MNKNSITATFLGGITAQVRSIEIRDGYEGLLEGTRTAYTRHCIKAIHDKRGSIAELCNRGEACGEYIVEPILVPEKYGDTYIGDCLPEYAVTTRFQASGKDDCLQLKLYWNITAEEFRNFHDALNKVTQEIDFMKYCLHIDWEDLS